MHSKETLLLARERPWLRLIFATRLTGVVATAHRRALKRNEKSCEFLKAIAGALSTRRQSAVYSKTQVFPLERNAAVRTRLTHSPEVQQVGRYIAKEILSRLKEQRAAGTPTGWMNSPDRLRAC